MDVKEKFLESNFKSYKQGGSDACKSILEGMEESGIPFVNKEMIMFVMEKYQLMNIEELNDFEKL